MKDLIITIGSFVFACIIMACPILFPISIIYGWGIILTGVIGMLLLTELFILYAMIEDECKDF